jgi:hypothetical protein
MLTFFLIGVMYFVLSGIIEGLKVPYHLGNPKYEFYYLSENSGDSLDMSQAAMFMNIDE